MKSSVIKRSVTIGGHKTSVTLEDVFWQGLHEIAESRSVPLRSLLNEIDVNRAAANLSSHIRLYVLDYYRSRSPETAGAHGNGYSDKVGSERTLGS